MFKIINGRWCNATEDPINVVEATELDKQIFNVRYFAGEKKLDHDKIEIIMSVLHTDADTDKKMIYALNNEPLN